MKRFSPERLRRARGRRSLRSIADQAGVSRYSIARWESGEGEPKATQLFLLARLTRRRIEYFFEAA